MVLRPDFYPEERRGLEVIQGSLLEEISRMISCIHAANYITEENSPKEAGYSEKGSKNSRNGIAIHIVEYITVEEPAFLGLFTKGTLKSNVICIVRFEGSCWKINNSEVFNTEKFADLFRHLKYYNMNVLLEGLSEDYLRDLYIESRKSRPGAIDRPFLETPGLVLEEE
jgi:hypothetical protein